MSQLNLAPEDLVAIAVFVGALLAFGALALAVGGAGAEAHKRTRARLAAAARPVPGAANEHGAGYPSCARRGPGFRALVAAPAAEPSRARPPARPDRTADHAQPLRAREFRAGAAGRGDSQDFSGPAPCPSRSAAAWPLG